MSDTISETAAETRESEAGTIELDRSARHELLAVRRRRLAIDVLESRVASIDLETIAREIAVREDADPSPETVERIAIELHHNHLPRLDEYGLVGYEPKARLVHATGKSLAAVDQPDSPAR